jgi:hypothetical protein
MCATKKALDESRIAARWSIDLGGKKPSSLIQRNSMSGIPDSVLKRAVVLLGVPMERQARTRDSIPHAQELDGSFLPVFGRII